MDARALVRILGDERARFVRLARRRVGSDADAEDIVQRALVRAVERSLSLEDPVCARAWFYRILRNAIADHHRASASEPSHGTEIDLDDLPDEGVIEARTPCTCSVRLLDELRPAYAEVIRHVDLDGEDPATAARAIGITHGNLEVRLHRARKSLRRGVRNYCGVGSDRPCLDCGCDEKHRCGSPP